MTVCEETYMCMLPHYIFINNFTYYIIYPTIENGQQFPLHLEFEENLTLIQSTLGQEFTMHVI